MLFIIMVIIISVGGILYLLLFDTKVKPPKNLNTNGIQPVDSSDQSENNISEEDVKIVFDEPSHVQYVEINPGPSKLLQNSEPLEIKEYDLISQTENKTALTTNSKINPFNF